MKNSIQPGSTGASAIKPNCAISQPQKNLLIAENFSDVTASLKSGSLAIDAWMATYKSAERFLEEKMRSGKKEDVNQAALYQSELIRMIDEKGQENVTWNGPRIYSYWEV